MTLTQKHTHIGLLLILTPKNGLGMLNCVSLLIWKRLCLLVILYLGIWWFLLTPKLGLKKRKILWSAHESVLSLWPLEFQTRNLGKNIKRQFLFGGNLENKRIVGLYVPFWTSRILVLRKDPLLLLRSKSTIPNKKGPELVTLRLLVPDFYRQFVCGTASRWWPWEQWLVHGLSTWPARLPSLTRRQVGKGFAPSWKLSYSTCSYLQKDSWHDLWI